MVACPHHCTYILPTTNLGLLVHMLLNHFQSAKEEKLQENWGYGREKLEWALQQHELEDVMRELEFQLWWGKKFGREIPRLKYAHSEFLPVDTSATMEFLPDFQRFHVVNDATYGFFPPVAGNRQIYVDPYGTKTLVLSVGLEQY